MRARGTGRTGAGAVAPRRTLRLGAVAWTTPVGLVLAAGLLAAILAAGACGSTESGPRPLRVFAASSLTEAFGEMASAFERLHPESEIVLVFAGSQVLRTQIERGAPADVFASADPVQMEALERAGLVTGSRLLAGNELVVIVPPSNPAGIERFGDLVRAERLVLGSPGVPVGSYAREILRRAEAGGRPGFAEAVLGRVVSQESNVRQLRAKVEMGEADAAIVYRTDAANAPVGMVAVPAGASVRARYLIGVVKGTENGGAAGRWVDLVASPEGRELLSRHGFLTGGNAGIRHE